MRGAALRSYPASEAGEAPLRETAVHSPNHSWFSLTISASNTAGARPVDGAVTVALSEMVWPGGRSAGSATRWSACHAVKYDATWLGQPPDDVAKCKLRCTGMLPANGHGWFPVLVTFTVTVWV